MNKERITDAELSEIRERADKDTGSVADYGPGTLSLRREIVRQDVPKLLAEIERYRESVKGIKEKIELNDERIRELKSEPQYYDPKGKIDTMNGQAHGLETALEIIGSDSE